MLHKFVQDVIDLPRINSATKYPSIPTFHAMERGRLNEAECLDFGPGPVIATEKIDGTNARIILTPAGYILGSREELLFAEGDLIGNPALSIVDTLRPLAGKLSETRSPAHLVVLYGEVFGGKVSAHSKEYTGEGKLGFNLFDVQVVSLDQCRYKPVKEVALAREQGLLGRWYDEEELTDFARSFDIPRVPTIEVPPPPKTLDGVSNWLSIYLPESKAALDAGAGRRPEGIVVRNADRSLIAKIRFEDYRRSLKGR